MVTGILKTSLAAACLAASMISITARADTTVEQLAGTWECFGPGQVHPLRPPILWFGGVTSKEGAPMAVDVDGFARDVSGVAAVQSSADGTLKIAPTQGQGLIASRFSEQGARVSMHVSREGVGDYRCFRLPRYEVPALPLPITQGS